MRHYEATHGPQLIYTPTSVAAFIMSINLQMKTAHPNEYLSDRQPSFAGLAVLSKVRKE